MFGGHAGVLGAPCGGLRATPPLGRGRVAAATLVGAIDDLVWLVGGTHRQFVVDHGFGHARRQRGLLGGGLVGRGAGLDCDAREPRLAATLTLEFLQR